MRIALTYNVKTTGSADEAEFDSPSTVDAIESALGRAGHTVERIEVTRPLAQVVARLETIAPDFVFNRAYGSTGQTRTTFYPALFDELGFPYVTLEAHKDELVAAQGRKADFDAVIQGLIRSACERLGLQHLLDNPEPRPPKKNFVARWFDLQHEARNERDRSGIRFS